MNNSLKLAGAALLAMSISAWSYASPINGSINFTGEVQLGTATGSITTDVNTATQVLQWQAFSNTAPYNTTASAIGNAGNTYYDDGIGFAQVTSRSGAFSSIAANYATYTLASFSQPWSFNASATPFWQVGGFTFDLTSASVSTALNSVTVNGLGNVSGNGYDVTAGAWTFTVQNNAAGGVFSWSANSSAPDGATTAILVGFSLLAVGLFMRRRVTTV